MSAVVVTVAAPGALRGQLLGQPAGWGGVSTVTAWALSRSHPHNASFGLSFEAQAEGSAYLIEGLAPGQYSLTFEDSEGLRVSYPKMGRASPVCPSGYFSF